MQYLGDGGAFALVLGGQQLLDLRFGCRGLGVHLPLLLCALLQLSSLRLCRGAAMVHREAMAHAKTGAAARARGAHGLAHRAARQVALERHGLRACVATK